MRRPGVMLLTAVVLFAGCNSITDTADAPEPGPSPEGCFELMLGNWSRQPEDYIPPPARFELTADTGTHALEAGRKRIGSRPGDPQNRYTWSWWEITPRDSLRLVFSTGFTGVTMILGRMPPETSSAAWRGSATAFVDYSTATPTATASLTPRACP